MCSFRKQEYSYVIGTIDCYNRVVKNKKNIKVLPVIVYIVLFLLSISLISIHASKGMHISSFWKRELPFITMDSSIINGVEIDSFKCPMFMDPEEGTVVTMTIKNKADVRETAGVTFLASKTRVNFKQVVTTQKLYLEPGNKETLTWKVNNRHVVDGKASVRVFLGITPDHPVNSGRNCIILPWRGPFSVKFMNSWAYPLLILLFILSAVWLYFGSGLDWQNRKRFFFFCFANIVVLVMVFLLMIRGYMVALIVLAFLIVGVIATFQRSPYLSVEEYKNYI